MLLVKTDVVAVDWMFPIVMVLVRVELDWIVLSAENVLCGW